MQDIRIFLVRAKNNTYITGENEIIPSQPGSHDFRYEDGDYLYMDTYLGGQKFIGGERVWIKNHAECFSGEERIYCRQKKVYACMFHGGTIL